MEKGKPKVQLLLEAVFNDAIENHSKAASGQLISALCVQLDMEAGEVQVYDEHETLLAKNIIFEWAEQYAKNPRLYKQAVHFIRVALSALKSRKIFDSPQFEFPFRVAITDDNFHEIETVFTIEGAETFTEGGRLMKNLDQELYFFSKKIFGN